MAFSLESYLQQNKKKKSYSREAYAARAGLPMPTIEDTAQGGHKPLDIVTQTLQYPQHFLVGLTEGKIAPNPYSKETQLLTPSKQWLHTDNKILGTVADIALDPMWLVGGGAIGKGISIGAKTGNALEAARAVGSVTKEGKIVTHINQSLAKNSAKILDETAPEKASVIFGRNAANKADELGQTTLQAPEQAAKISQLDKTQRIAAAQGARAQAERQALKGINFGVGKFKYGVNISAGGKLGALASRAPGALTAARVASYVPSQLSNVERAKLPEKVIAHREAGAIKEGGLQKGIDTVFGLKNDKAVARNAQVALRVNEHAAHRAAKLETDQLLSHTKGWDKNLIDQTGEVIARSQRHGAEYDFNMSPLENLRSVKPHQEFADKNEKVKRIGEKLDKLEAAKKPNPSKIESTKNKLREANQELYTAQEIAKSVEKKQADTLKAFNALPEEAQNTIKQSQAFLKERRLLENATGANKVEQRHGYFPVPREATKTGASHPVSQSALDRGPAGFEQHRGEFFGENFDWQKALQGRIAASNKSLNQKAFIDRISNVYGKDVTDIKSASDLAELAAKTGTTALSPQGTELNRKSAENFAGTAPLLPQHLVKTVADNELITKVPEAATEAGKPFVKGTNLFKNLAYTLNPGSAVIDRLGNLTNQFQQNPAVFVGRGTKTAAKSQKESVQLARYMREYGNTEKKAALGNKLITRPDGSKIKVSDLADELIARGVLDNNYAQFDAEAAAAGLRGKVRGTKGEKPVQTWDKFRDLRGANDNDTRGFGFLQNSHIAYNKFLKEGLTPRQALEQADALAASNINKSNFDYSPSANTWFEKTIARRVAPFYTFTRQNAAFQGANLIERPALSSAYWRTQQGLQQDKNGNQLSPDYMIPGYLRAGQIRLGGKPGENSTWIDPKLPIQTQGQFQGRNGFDIATGIGMLSPFVKAPLEIKAGHKLDDPNQKVQGNASYLAKTFLGFPAGLATTELNKNKTDQQKRDAWLRLAGISLSRVNEKDQAGYAQFNLKDLKTKQAKEYEKAGLIPSKAQRAADKKKDSRRRKRGTIESLSLPQLGR